MLRVHLGSRCQTLESSKNHYCTQKRWSLSFFPKWTAQEPLSLLNWDRLLSRPPSTYVGWDQEAPAQVLVKREAPGFSVPIHAGNILLYCFIIEPEPYTIIIVDLQENKQQSRAMPSCYYGNRMGSTLTHTHTQHLWGCRKVLTLIGGEYIWVAAGKTCKKCH